MPHVEWRTTSYSFRRRSRRRGRLIRLGDRGVSSSNCEAERWSLQLSLRSTVNSESTEHKVRDRRRCGLFSAIGDLSVRDAVVLVGPSSHAVAASLERGSTNVHGHASIRILDESRVAASLVDPQTLVRQTTARDSSGRIVDNSAFGAGWVGDTDGAKSIPSLDSNASSPRRVGGWRGGRRWFAAALAVVAVAGAVAGTVVVSTRDRNDSRLTGSVTATAEDEVEIVEASKEQETPAPKTSISSIESGATPELTRVDVGSVAAEVPSDWKLLSRGPRAGVPIWYPVRVRIARSWSSRNVLRKVWDSIPSKLFCVSSFRRSRTHCGSQSLLCSTMPQENGQWCTSSFRTISPRCVGACTSTTDGK